MIASTCDSNRTYPMDPAANKGLASFLSQNQASASGTRSYAFEPTKETWSSRNLHCIAHQHVIHSLVFRSSQRSRWPSINLPNKLIGTIIAPLRRTCQFSSRALVQRYTFPVEHESRPKLGRTHRIVGGSRNSGSETPPLFRTSLVSARR